MTTEGNKRQICVWEGMGYGLYLENSINGAFGVMNGGGMLEPLNWAHVSEEVVCMGYWFYRRVLQKSQLSWKDLGFVWNECLQRK